MKPTLFRPEQNLEAEEFKRHLPVNINLRFETLSPHLALCEETYLRPLLGKALFNRMAAYIDDNPTLPDGTPDCTLIDKARFALIRLALWKGYDIIAANISDTGVSTEVDKENRPFRYQEENIKRTLKEEGFNYLDNILEFLEENAQEFPEFGQSPHKLSNVASLIRDTRTFNTYYNIDNSRLVFLKMRYYLRDVELIELRHRIGADFYRELLSADETEARYAAILTAIRSFVVYRAVAEGIGELHKLPTEKGLLFETSTMDGVQQTPVYRAQILETRQRLAERAEQHLAAALHHLAAHADLYPNYTAFAGNSPADGVIHRDNTNRKTFLA
mgnify:CR=1 FL=1